MRTFLGKMEKFGSQGYLRPFALDDEQSIGVDFPNNPVIRIVASRYRSYLGEPFHGVVMDNSKVRILSATCLNS
jgi:branched-subunit amino acid aminotransferase/4-amino-4-deoxychorismate lyase